MIYQMFMIPHNSFEMEWVKYVMEEFVMIFTRGPFGLRVLSSPASVCVCVSVCVSTFACLCDNSSPIQARII